MNDEEARARYRYLQLKQKAASFQEPSIEQQGQSEPDLASTLYHGAIEGGAMTVGGAAGAVLGAPAGPIGSGLAGVGLAAAMYPPAKRFAEGIDRMRGIQPQGSPSPIKEFGEGIAIEAGGKALTPIAKGLGKMLPGAKTGEMISGTPKQNLSRAYQQGFAETYLKPKRLVDAGEAFGDAKFNMIGNTITPEEQVAMAVNPRGEANQKVADIMLKWIKGEPITASEALAARQGTDTIFPADTARKQVQRGSLGQFRSAMNDVIAKENPEFNRASKDYAASKLRSDLLKPARVNKSNPDQYSKLGGMLNALALTGGAVTGNVLPAIAATVGGSPLAMGLISSMSGSASRVGVPNVARRAIISQLIDRITTKDSER